LLVDGLSYVRRFTGLRVMVHLSGSAAIKPMLLAITAGHGRARVHVDPINFGERVVGLGDLSHRVRELARLLPGRVAEQLSVRGPGRRCVGSKRTVQDGHAPLGVCTGFGGCVAEIWATSLAHA